MGDFTDFAAKRGTSSRQRTKKKSGPGLGLSCTVKVKMPTREQHNFRVLVRCGPKIGNHYRRWIVARDPGRGRVLVGGLGIFGVGEAWEKESVEHRQYEGFAEAPERDSTGQYGTTLHHYADCPVQRGNADREAETYEKYLEYRRDECL